jgi:hypothetical protein
MCAVALQPPFPQASLSVAVTMTAYIFHQRSQPFVQVHSEGALSQPVSVSPGIRAMAVPALEASPSPKGKDTGKGKPTPVAQTQPLLPTTKGLALAFVSINYNWFESAFLVSSVGAQAQCSGLCCLRVCACVYVCGCGAGATLPCSHHLCLGVHKPPRFTLTGLRKCGPLAVASIQPLAFSRVPCLLSLCVTMMLGRPSSSCPAWCS